MNTVKGVLLKANEVTRNGVMYTEECLKQMNGKRVLVKDQNDKISGEVNLIFDEKQKVLCANVALGVQGTVEKSHMDGPIKMIDEFKMVSMGVIAND